MLCRSGKYDLHMSASLIWSCLSSRSSWKTPGWTLPRVTAAGRVHIACPKRDTFRVASKSELFHNDLVIQALEMPPLRSGSRVVPVRSTNAHQRVYHLEPVLVEGQRPESICGPHERNATSSIRTSQNIASIWFRFTEVSSYSSGMR